MGWRNAPLITCGEVAHYAAVCRKRLMFKERGDVLDETALISTSGAALREALSLHVQLLEQFDEKDDRWTGIEEFVDARCRMHDPESPLNRVLAGDPEAEIDG